MLKSLISVQFTFDGLEDSPLTATLAKNSFVYELTARLSSPGALPVRFVDAHDMRVDLLDGKIAQSQGLATFEKGHFVLNIDVPLAGPFGTRIWAKAKVHYVCVARGRHLLSCSIRGHNGTIVGSQAEAALAHRTIIPGVVMFDLTET